MKASYGRRGASASTRKPQPKQPEDEFNDLLVNACDGDPRAIGAIAIALGPALLEEARLVLGNSTHEADSLLDEFLDSLATGHSRFTPAKGDPLVWMGRVVRRIAQQCLRARARYPGVWTMAKQREQYTEEFKLDAVRMTYQAWNTALEGKDPDATHGAPRRRPRVHA